MSSNHKKTINVKAQGSLGLLALGDLGLKLWREARHKEESESDQENPTNQDSSKKQRNDGK